MESSPPVGRYQRSSACVHALARAGSHGRAFPRGLVAWGAGRPVGPGVRGLVSGIGSFGRAGFFGSCGNSLLLGENYNRTTTNNTTEAESARRLNGGGGNNLSMTILASCGLASPGSHWPCRIAIHRQAFLHQHMSELLPEADQARAGARACAYAYARCAYLR